MRFSNWWGDQRGRKALFAALVVTSVTFATFAAPHSAGAQTDADQDGVPDAQDNCSSVFNPGQEDDVHPNSDGDACDDPEDSGLGDDVFDDRDNCPDDINPDQEDADGDHLGDACDTSPDTDGDGFADSIDTCSDVWNGGRRQKLDINGNGSADACEPTQGDPFDFCSSGSPDQFANGGFESGLSGWTSNGDVTPIGSEFDDPIEGSSMAQLGISPLLASDPQSAGANGLCQKFSLPTNGDQSDFTFRFAYSLWTFDTTGKDALTVLAGVGDFGSTEIVSSITRPAYGGNLSQKSSGWQAITLQFDPADAGEVAFIKFVLTTDAERATWVYVDGEGPIDPLTTIDEGSIDSSTATVADDPHTDDPFLLMPAPDKSEVAIPFEVDCPPLGGDLVGTDAKLFPLVGPPIDLGSGGGVVTIPVDLITTGDLVVTAACEEFSIADLVAQMVLYDPSGIITDASDGDPVVGATVTLFNVPGWTAAAADPEGPTECQSNASRAAGEDWNQPAPVELGVLADLGMIMPAVSEQSTNSIGYYGWNVAAGCWFVTVEAPGYRDLTSPVVGVPTAVTDLDLELQRTGGGSGGPSPLPSPTPTGGGGGSELPPEEIPLCGKEEAEVCGTKEDDHIVIDITDDTDGDGLVTVHSGPGDDEVCLDESAGVTARVLGGTGNDLLEVRRCTAPSTPTVKPALGPYGVKITAPSIALFFGGIGRDILRGGNAGDLLNTGTGVDRVRGGGGGDIMKSSRGRDILSSGDGNDWLYGGRAADVLRGGEGVDRMLGGHGFDTCAGGDGREELEDCESEKWNF